MNKIIFNFKSKESKKIKNSKNFLGGKGANLSEMGRMGLPVPPGFTISTKACEIFYKDKKRLNLNKNKSLNQNILFMLSNIGYDVSKIGKNNRKNFSLLIRAYQMHFRQKIVNGKLDKETLKMIVSHFNQTLTI